ncbi:MAG: hypothetical protein ABEK12_02590 [Candidatus Nanohaloarchaea archaeon]
MDETDPVNNLEEGDTLAYTTDQTSFNAVAVGDQIRFTVDRAPSPRLHDVTALSR